VAEKLLGMQMQRFEDLLAQYADSIG